MEANNLAGFREAPSRLEIYRVPRQTMPLPFASLIKMGGSRECKLNGKGHGSSERVAASAWVAGQLAL